MRTLREFFDRLVAAKVQLPYFHFARAPRGFFDALFGFVALVEAPNAENDFGCLEASEMGCSFTAETSIGAGNDDSLSTEVVIGIGKAKFFWL